MTHKPFELRDVLESKRALRDQLAALPIEEKLRLLERLRERTLTIIASRHATDREGQAKATEEPRDSRKP